MLLDEFVSGVESLQPLMKLGSKFCFYALDCLFCTFSWTVSLQKKMRDASCGNKLKIALFGELSLEKAIDLSRDRQIHDTYLNEKFVSGHALIFETTEMISMKFCNDSLQ
jgi:hypothetical protein